jgi:hypothetical protein
VQNSTVTITTAIAAAAATAIGAGLAGVVNASAAHADAAADGGARGLGTQAAIVNGDNVQGWTISDLKPSADAIPYTVQGVLWEATATDEALNGFVVPVVLDLDARAPTGQTYPVLYQVATPQGVNPSALTQGQKTTGKLYFDVTGDKPNGVVYDAGGQELASWEQSQAPQHGRDRATTSSAPSRPAGTQKPEATIAASGIHQVPAERPPTPAPATSQGTPIAGSQGTTLPANSPVAPAPGAGSPASTPANVGLAPAPVAGPPPPANGPAAPPPGAGSPASTPANVGLAPAPVAGPPPPANGPAAPAPANSVLPPAAETGPPPPANGPAAPAPAPANSVLPPAAETGPPPSTDGTAAPVPSDSKGSAGTPIKPGS